MRRTTLALIATIVALLTSCAHVQRGGDLRETRDSVYKIKVTLKLDLTPLIAWQVKQAEERRKRAEEEQPQSQPIRYIAGEPVVLVNELLDMDVQVLEEVDTTATIGWSGTGWVVGRARGRSYIMTAGHVCESKDVYPVEVFSYDWEKEIFFMETIELPIIEKHHNMLGRDGVESMDAKLIRDEDLDNDFNGNDLCVVGVGTDLGQPIPIASSDPAYGERCSVVGAPTGLWGGGVAVASEPLFSGRGSVFGVEPDGLSFNGLLAPGNSGSAVVCRGRVVGVISLGSTRFRSLVHAVPHERIREFLKKALHRE